ncbi:3-dehydro-L-gulonate-6-phosphate decarboxylase [Spiroplasma sp. SV19]|uniref:3-dehydro-L-gulonate-6-phosphate decarboxylase n=1 Tax=Spiroplasma sp. SV19 TaxID=2570468 RepID=UPI0024B87592|nr:3-dehydro-L-gulonate-6-phosphate decarboxylase [Spiroplasma sp. SV19]WHQ37117.1 3-dehydro-L-gulonate-6-phosphate decarboxylase [Spiroplasma sp. SV19]
MQKPLLQIALDCLTLEEAMTTLTMVGDIVDVIEVGTILLCAEGKRAITAIKECYPNKIVLTDGKIADAGKILGEMLFTAKADIITVICCADLATIKNVVTLAKTAKKDMQIELTGQWDFEQAKSWRAVGVEQVVYHRSRDAQAAGSQWGAADFDKITQLVALGFKVTLTGGVEITDLALFTAFPIYIVIAGRAIRDAADPREAALSFQQQLQTKWQ